MAEALLHSVASLAHPARETLLWKYGASTPPCEVASVIADLESRGGYYEARIAATLAAASGNTEWAAAHLADTNPTVRRKAIRLSGALPDSSLRDALRDAPAAVRLDIYRALRGHSDLASRLIVLVRTEWGDDEASRILPWCSGPTVIELLPSLLLALSHTRQWRQLAINHPQPLYDALAADLIQSVQDGIQPDAWWSRYHIGVGMLVKHAGMATGALDLMTAHECKPVLFGDYLTIFARLEPQRTLSLMAKETSASSHLRPSNGVYRRLARSGHPEVAGLAKFLSTSNDDNFKHFLKAMPPSQRCATYEAAKGTPSSPAELFRDHNSELTDILPRSYVLELARKALPSLRSESWPNHLPALARLPPDEVQQAFLDATRRHDPEHRSAAWTWYITNARLYGADALAVATSEAAIRLRNEQQPVRQEAIWAMSEVPAHLWNTEALSHITAIANDAINARDQGNEWGMLNEIASNVLVAHADSPEHVQWVHDSFQLLTKHARALSMPSLGLRKGQEQVMWNAYKPFIRRDAERNESHTLRAFARALRKRVTKLPELQDALWEVVTSDDLDWNVQEAIELWLKASPAERVAKVLEYDASTCAVPAVATVIATQRTDLLDGALGTKAPEGRFTRYNQMWIFDAPRGSPRRWTDTQTAKYLDQIKACVSDPDVATWEKTGPLRQVKGLPGSLDYARYLASTDDSVLVTEAALGALVTSPADLELLYSFAGTDRARVAIHTASGAARRERPSVLEPYLVDILSRKGGVKITSRKEAIRQATSLLPIAVSGPLLTRLIDTPDLHPSVLAAAVPAATRLLPTQAAWDVIEGALTVNELAVKQEICNVTPLAVFRDDRGRYANYILRLANDSNEDVMVAALGALGDWAPFTTAASGCLSDTITSRTALTRAWQAAAGSLVHWGSVEDLEKVMLALIASMDEHEYDANGQPYYGRIDDLTTHLQAKAETSTKHRAASRSVGQYLATYGASHRDVVSLVAPLKLAALDKSSADTVLADLRSIADLIKDRPVLADELRGTLSHHRTRYPEGMESVARALYENGRAVEGMLALGIVQSQGKSRGWPHEWQELLHAMRQHADPDVRILARKTKMAKKERWA